MNVLVTGCNGLIGCRVVTALLEAGQTVTGMDMRPLARTELTQSPRFSFIQMDLNQDAIPDLKLLNIDAVVHLAIAMRPGRTEPVEGLLEGTYRLLDAMQLAQVPCFIGMSSLAVLDFAEIAAGSVIDENSPRCQDPEQMGRYAALKARQEEVFVAFGEQHPLTRTVILRPGLVYQQDDISDAYVGLVKTGFAISTTHNGLIPTLALQSLITAISLTVEKLKTLPQNTIFNLVDEALPTQSEYLTVLQQSGKVPSRLVKLPWRALAGLANLVYRIFRLSGMESYLPDLLKPQAFATRLKPFSYSNQKAKQLLAWQPNHFNK